ncbi:endoribonuclease ysh1 [Orbilia brochopaga]|uniref:Endoribonuclease ysh1 n=1 Tax=Orbilia brochopaga TaxID=3140254 RepID=A0AAV9V2X2_9PEZI
MANKRKADASVDEVIDPSDMLSFICLGGGSEVGRSCHIVQYKGKTVMLDAGVHPAYEGISSLPFYDDFDLSTVDILLISHFHLDHAGSLPYVLTKTNFRGRVFMTHPTKAIYKWLMSDSVRVSNTTSEQTTQLFSETDHLSSFSQISAIDYHQTLHHASIAITPYPAGHVLGAAMFLIEIAGLKILFTGDYSREEDRHLVSATLPKHVKPDILITESTYGTASHMPRPEKEARFLSLITSILDRGGRVLMPVFALGRAQELLLILEEYWEMHEKYQQYPIYYASSLARRCMTVYQTYIGAMNDNIRSLFRSKMAAIGEAAGKNGQALGGTSPFDMKWVRSLKSLDRFDDVGGCVMLAAPGMMQNGVSRELLERWCPDPKNGVILTGYSVEGTLAKSILNEPTEIQAFKKENTSRRSGREEAARVMIPRRCSIDELSFAAHVDYGQNSSFIEEVGAKVIILVHGETNAMGRLKSALLSKYHDRKDKPRIYNPKNCEELHIPFKGEKIANVIGKLAKHPPHPSHDIDKAIVKTVPEIFAGVLVQNDFKLSLMSPDDLREYAGLTTTTVVCKQRVPLSSAGAGLVRWSLESMFGGIVAVKKEKPSGFIQEVDDDEADDANEKAIQPEPPKETAEHTGDEVYRVMDCVTVACRSGYVELEWEGNIHNDGIADAILAILLSIESSPASVKYSSKPHSHNHDRPSDHANVSLSSRLDRVLWFLEEQFGDNIQPIEPADDVDIAKGQVNMRLRIQVDEHEAIVQIDPLEVECKFEALRQRIMAVLERAIDTVAPFVDLQADNAADGGS